MLNVEHCRMSEQDQNRLLDDPRGEMSIQLISTSTYQGSFIRLEELEFMKST